MNNQQKMMSKKQLRLQDFEIEYKLGQGAYGYVFLASRNNEQFAIKEMNKFKLRKLHRQYLPLIEKQLLKTINHPGIIKSYCAFQNTNYLYLVLEYCPESQFQTIILNNLLTQASRKFYVAELVNIIEYLHLHGIIHRDLKPSNLLLSKQRHLKLIDFGTADISQTNLLSQNFKIKINAMKTAKKEEESLSQIPGERMVMRKRSTFVGTTGFLSPELVEHSQCLPASDLWALGCIIYYLYYGRPPFLPQNQFQFYQSIQNAEIEYPNSVTIPDEALDLMRKLLVKQPERRLGSCYCEDLSFKSLKNHAYFNGINVDQIFEKDPPFIETPESQIQQKLQELRLQANLSYKQPGPDNIFEKLLVKAGEKNQGIYLCHFKKKLFLEQYQTIGMSDSPAMYKLQKDKDNNIAHLLSQNKFSIGVEDSQRLIYYSKDSKAVCKLLNQYYSQKNQQNQESIVGDTIQKEY